MKITERLQQWGGRAMSRFSFRNATIILCFFNLITALFLIHAFISPPNSNRSDQVLLKYIKESEELRRAMEPVDLIKRVREIEREGHEEVDTLQEKDAKQSAALDLISRLNNHRTYSDADNQKALEEWRKRKMERARQRGLGRNGTTVSQE
ncbi:hypothetical protein HanRHA438_Chr01g0035441 [Helianthus annuus]|uniref:Transmembrane protein n=1 Tax=Helianthus annuus TaxID=4232 RepID=A0A251VQG5_HELAN|nr:uncharacterized protein LOC110878061 [Helianthus annuus]KAF5823095.1 hypothetical protein HanXRQr2_Chr01g0034631 [Helianthus annuus]KAJ0612491.1 hypothetical protein HanHA300_Chr01g0028131 [Helianthus annuus]KAJ0623985.1 hypothetical protein HanIR_Chr01g0038301 [Helianthus annuus]KAJ0627852.1 hypothetical protein HanHA89_Chr01g0030421 [Helianthus annuus]KAJ0784130.1 hypothetical protein HanLR1_Chr01g0028791 [Helianthus annuus]